MKEFDKMIAEMYPTMKEYLPRLSSYLMNLHMDEPTKDCQKVLQIYANLIMVSFCNYFKYQDYLTIAYDYAKKSLSNEEFANKNYLKFIDGKLYDKTYSPEYLNSLLLDAAISFDIPIIDNIASSPETMINYVEYLINIINHIQKKTNINSELYLTEYLEQCFLNFVKSNLETYIEYEDSLQNK